MSKCAMPIGIVVLASFLGGCALTLPVTGRSDSGDETFTGTATGYSDGGGNLEIASNRGLRCTGSFVYVTRREGRGTFNCSNGQSGPFEFVSTGLRGTGTGQIGPRRFTFTFG
jgi:hypothetical protein